ncbi:MAG: DUF3990 domain-containing protein [Fibromonadaceae bacterium]|jgi:hypothetical protein|nr:DUF3990 domain-containing protein [Fibromonadaceae bacterium]
MILYHGSYLVIEKPDLSFSRITFDFGKGFYTTPIKDQAKKWSKRFIDTKGQGILSAFEFDESSMQSLNCLTFESYSEEWLEFIVSCRTGNDIGVKYQIIIGGIANDNVFDTIEEYLQGYRTKEQAIARLRFEKPNVQYCFKEQSVMDKYLRFVSSEEIK